MYGHFVHEAVVKNGEKKIRCYNLTLMLNENYDEVENFNKKSYFSINETAETWKIE